MKYIVVFKDGFESGAFTVEQLAWFLNTLDLITTFKIVPVIEGAGQ